MQTYTYTATATNKTLTGSIYGNNIFNLGAGGDTVTTGPTQGQGNTVNFGKGDGHATVNFIVGSAADLYLGADVKNSEIKAGVSARRGRMFIPPPPRPKRSPAPASALTCSIFRIPPHR